MVSESAFDKRKSARPFQPNAQDVTIPLALATRLFGPGWLVAPAVIVTALVPFYGRLALAALAALILAWNVGQLVLTRLGVLQSPAKRHIVRGRWAGKLDGDFVVFLIGARLNSPNGLATVRKMGEGMGQMLKELEADPASGLLNAESYLSMGDMSSGSRSSSSIGVPWTTS